MKKLIWILLLTPTLVLGQGHERFQKQQFRGGGSGMGTTQTPRTQSYEYSQKQQFRNPPSTGGSNYYYYGGYYDPYFGGYWGFNRWNYWGPYNYYYPFYWYDNWGYRNPARVYVYEGKLDTVKVEVPTTVLGLSFNSGRELGGWLTVGRKNYFIMEYSHSFQSDNSTFYSNITIQDAIDWNDRELKDQVNTGLFSLGLGTHVKKELSVYGQLGFGSKTVRKKYYDELRVLSNNGEYSFPYTHSNVTTVKVGAIYHMKKVLTKFDADIVRQTYSVGIGIKL